MGCQVLGTSCSGASAAGRHASTIFDPRSPADAPAVASPGSFSYEVPDGWANAEDWLSAVRLMPDEDYEAKVRFTGAPVDQISVLARPVAAIAAAPDCEPVATTSADATIEDLATWLTGHPDLTASEPTRVTIDGHDGLVLDIDMADDPLRDCLESFGGTPGVPLFGNAAAFDGDGRFESDWRVGTWELGTGFVCSTCTSDPLRVTLLDVDGRPILIVIDAADPADQAAFLEQAMPIVQSFEFPE
jgi:hypothetical protein